MDHKSALRGLYCNGSSPIINMKVNRSIGLTLKRPFLGPQKLITASFKAKRLNYNYNREVALLTPINLARDINQWRRPKSILCNQQRQEAVGLPILIPFIDQSEATKRRTNGKGEFHGIFRLVCQIHINMGGCHYNSHAILLFLW